MAPNGPEKDHATEICPQQRRRTQQKTTPPVAALLCYFYHPLFLLRSAAVGGLRLRQRFLSKDRGEKQHTTATDSVSGLTAGFCDLRLL